MTQDWRKEFVASANEYVKETNQYLGLAAFTIGISCIGKQPLYAWLGLILLPFIWQSRFVAYKHRLNALRGIDHEAMRPMPLLLRCWPALAGWLFLGYVAIGVIRA